MKDSVDKHEINFNVTEYGTVEITGRVETIEGNDDKCEAVIVHFAVDVDVITFTRTELLFKMYDVLAKAARADIDAVGDIESEIDEVRAGAPLSDYVWYFELGI